VYVAPKPQNGLKNAVSNIGQEAAITLKRYELGCQLVSMVTACHSEGPP